MQEPVEKSFEEETRRHPRVLKLSEGALFCNGEYLGEICNQYNPSSQEMFTWYPDLGLSIETSRKDYSSGQKQIIELLPQDYVKLPFGLGHVTLLRMLGSDEYVGVDRFFHDKYYTMLGSLNRKLDVIKDIAERRLGISRDAWQWRIESAAREAVSIDPQYSPELLFRCLLLGFKNPDNWSGFNSIGEELLATNFFEMDESQSRDTLFSFVYAYGRVFGYDLSSPESTKEMLYEFPYIDELRAEYKTNSDGRFGDALLVACELLEKEWAKAERD